VARRGAIFGCERIGVAQAAFLAIDVIPEAFFFRIFENVAITGMLQAWALLATDEGSQVSLTSSRMAQTIVST
jgi:hypothetical protein